MRGTLDGTNEEMRRSFGGVHLKEGIHRNVSMFLHANTHGMILTRQKAYEHLYGKVTYSQKERI